MSRIVNLQRSLRERGRIRIGVSEKRQTSRGERKVPRKLSTFAFSAPDEQTVAMAAEAYGGTLAPWDEGGRDRYRVISEVASVPVIFPTQMQALSQSYEQWAGGFCIRRCNGVTAQVPSKAKGVRFEEEDCSCEPDQRACQTVTNLSVILPELPGLGTWRLVSHGWYAATELGGAVELIEAALAAGVRVPARLFLEQRERRVLVAEKPEVLKYAVPVLDLDMSVGALGSGGVAGPGHLLAPGAGALPGAPTMPALPAGATDATNSRPQGWRPVQQEALPPAPVVGVRDQLADNDRQPTKRRANATPEIRPTGTTPRKAADVDDGRCSLCGNEYGSASLKKNPEPGGSRYVHSKCAADMETPADDPAASQEQGPPVGEAQSGDGPLTAAEPSPAGNGRAKPPASKTADRPMTHNQHRKVMALGAEVWPAGEGMTGAEADDMRRTNMLRLAAVLGQPGLTSRQELSHATAGPLIEAMEAIKEGALRWDGLRLVNVETGEFSVAAP